MILVSEKKEIFKYNSDKHSIEWKFKFDSYVTGVSKVDNFVFVTTSSWWGNSLFTTLIDYSSGQKKWTIKQVLYSIHIHENALILIDTKKEIVSISLETGNENFRVKMNMFSWYEQPRVSIIDKKIYLFSPKKTFQLNETTGSLNESKLPSKLNPKEITFLIDEFQVDINTLPNSDGSGVMIDGGGAGDGGGGGGE